MLLWRPQGLLPERITSRFTKAASKDGTTSKGAF
jgi:hypothetical protein